MKNNTSKNKILIIATVFAMLLLSLIAFNWKSVDASTENSSIACTACKGSDKDTIFNTNISFIKEAALDYFTNERLPQKIGAKQTITLGKMIEEKLIHKVVDSNGKTCSLTDSYVEVTKFENEYVYKINLSCSDVTDYVLVHKGCYDYCNNNSCNNKPTPTPTPTPDEKEYEYEYKKTKACTMTDWSPWTKWKTEREVIKDYNYKREETKTEEITKKEIVKVDAQIETKFNCDQYEGYELLGRLCVKTNSELLIEDAELNPRTYNCNHLVAEGYVLDSTGKNCIKETSTIDSVPAKQNPITYNCKRWEADGFKYNSQTNLCEKTTTKIESKPAEEGPVTYGCSDELIANGYIYNSETNKCEKIIEEILTKPAEEGPVTYGCSADLIANGYIYNIATNKCEKIYEETLTKPAEPDPTTYGCSADLIANGYIYNIATNKCEKTITETLEQTPEKVTTYNCDKYAADGYKLNKETNRCEKTTITEKDAIPQYGTREVEYGCRKEVCSIKQVLDCSTGICVMKDEKTCEYVNTTCTRTEEYIKEYNCPDEYKLSDKNGKICIKSKLLHKTPTKVTTYNCKKWEADGYKYNSTTNMCEKKVTNVDQQPATPNPTTYNCKKWEAEGYKYNSITNMCEKKVTNVDQQPATPNPTTLNCDKWANEGYKYNSATKQCEKKVTNVDQQPATPNPITYNCKKWEADGYKYNSTTNMCEKIVPVVETKPADPDPATYGCDDNLIADGYKYNSETNKCEKTITTTDTKPAEPNPDTYNCNKHEGYTVVGNKCVKPVCDICSKEADKVEIEVCPEGYTLENGKCSKEVEKTVKVTYYRYSTRTCEGGSTETRWSTDRNDSVLIAQGFKKTGKTRLIVLNK